MENPNSYRRKRRMLHNTIFQTQEQLDEKDEGEKSINATIIKENPYSAIGAQNDRHRLRGTTNAKLDKVLRENQRYECNPFDDELDQQVSPFRYSVHSGPEEGIDCLRESNPFFNFSSDTAHKVFDKLVKNNHDPRQRLTTMKQETVKVEQQKAMKRSGSMHKIENKMKSVSKILKLEGRVEESTQEKKESRDSALKKPPIAKNSFVRESPYKGSFSLKNKNNERMKNLMYGTKRRQSNADKNIMDILNSSIKRRNSESKKDTLDNSSRYVRRTMNIDDTSNQISRHGKSFSPNFSAPKIRNNTAYKRKKSDSCYYKPVDPFEESKMSPFVSAADNIEELEYKPGGAPLLDENDNSFLNNDQIIQDLEFEVSREHYSRTMNDHRVSTYKVRDSNRRKRLRKSSAEKENNFKASIINTADLPELAAQNHSRSMRNSRAEENERPSQCKSTGDLRNPQLDQSVDSIGEAADVTISMEDLPLTPTMSVLSPTDMFNPTGLKKVEVQAKAEVKYSRDFVRNQRFGRLNKHADIVSYENHEIFPDYPGYYFREIYRNTALELLESNQKLDVELTDHERNCDNDSVIPELTDRIVDDNKVHATQSMQGLYYINTLQPTDAYKDQKVTLPPTDKKKLAVFDMDETLIHCVFDRAALAKKTNGIGKTDVMLKFKFSSEGLEYLPVNIRPFIRECLLELKQYYQIIVFTASKKEYADTILDHIDPDGELIEYRCYRDSCYTTRDYVYIKDLRIFEDQWEMKDIVLIDNAVHSFGFQIDNGIPMLPFFNDKKDKEMIYLAHYLKELYKQDDLRPMIENTFWIRRLTNNQILEAIEGVIEYAIEEVEEYVDDDFEFDELEKIDPNSGEGPIRESVTDLEITDDVDEREGETESSSSIAMYTRTMPCKPSSADDRMSNLHFNAQADHARTMPLKNQRFDKDSDDFSGPPTLSGDDVQAVKQERKKSKYLSNTQKVGLFNYKEAAVNATESSKDESWLQKNLNKLKSSFRVSGRSIQSDSDCI
ncbi:unnamed protein product [Moneuplotes crassus]|uniref:FCP1 homology domain-containing protein n=1 Tax=Euplotes crassus TaxID=5936 RepID=A0AAD1XM12_EUPCR|nr:unnamed protein product [Moneuplotes crassus]